MTHVLGTEPDIDDGAGEVTHVTVENRYPSSYPVAKRCQHCGGLVEAGAVHSTAIVQLERDDGETTARFPVFCDPDCLDGWVRSVSDGR